MINLEDITFEKVEELFGSSGPFLGDTYLQGRKLKGRFSVDNYQYSDEKKYILLMRLRGDSKVKIKVFRWIPFRKVVRDFRIVVIDRQTGKKYQSELIENALYIVNMRHDEILYHQAFHDRIQDFERRLKFDKASFKEMDDSEIYA